MLVPGGMVIKHLASTFDADAGVALVFVPTNDAWETKVWIERVQG
jgi:hypothetical protein